jgi:hypothetical protein
MTDATGEWEVVGRPYTTADGKNGRTPTSGPAGGKAGVTEVRMWGAYEEISVQRAEGK